MYSHTITVMEITASQGVHVCWVSIAGAYDMDNYESPINQQVRDDLCSLYEVYEEPTVDQKVDSVLGTLIYHFGMKIYSVEYPKNTIYY